LRVGVGAHACSLAGAMALGFIPNTVIAASINVIGALIARRLPVRKWKLLPGFSTFCSNFTRGKRFLSPGRPAYICTAGDRFDAAIGNL
jgi:hypothetical protein